MEYNQLIIGKYVGLSNNLYYITNLNLTRIEWVTDLLRYYFSCRESITVRLGFVGDS